MLRKIFYNLNATRICPSYIYKGETKWQLTSVRNAGWALMQLVQSVMHRWSMTIWFLRMATLYKFQNARMVMAKSNPQCAVARIWPARCNACDFATSRVRTKLTVCHCVVPCLPNKRRVSYRLHRGKFPSSLIGFPLFPPNVTVLVMVILLKWTSRWN